eukprot:TRINITY_DN46493_c0_g1_i9.p1 TRINITY_DN46493_c0_g1~~TRINITY_DN46493_c0_g1_i9.p1  ORF type:complete len:335 (+),score=37.29 TRINITY_DN46493_c0_g1_i9:263-1267(+)
MVATPWACSPSRIPGWLQITPIHEASSSAPWPSCCEPSPRRLARNPLMGDMVGRAVEWVFSGTTARCRSALADARQRKTTDRKATGRFSWPRCRASTTGMRIPRPSSCWPRCRCRQDSNCLIDLSKLTGDETEIFGPGSLSWHGKAERRPPVSPSVFSSMLARGVEDGEISFTKRGDVPLVSEIYKRAFVSQLRETTELNYFSFGWTDVEAEAFAEFLHSASTSEVGLRVHSIYLGLNHIGEHGMLCISDALVRGAVPALKKLYLGGNQVTAAAREALTRARPSLVLGGVEETQTHERRVRDAALREDDEPAERPRSNGTTAKAAKASVSCTAL